MARRRREGVAVRRRALVVAVAIGIAVGSLLPLAAIDRISLENAVVPPAGLLAFEEHVDHIVFLVMENHAFDNYYGDYCLAESPACPTANAGLSLATCIPLHPFQTSNGSCIRPFAYTATNWTITSGLPHTWISSVQAFNNGSMNDFYTAEESGFDPFGYYTGATAPIYWDIAQEFGLGDAFFSSVLDYSLPNHWHIVAGQAPAQIVTNFTDFAPGGTTIAGDQKYLDQANGTESVEDLLLHTSVSWKYYDFVLGNYSAAIRLNASYPNGYVGSAFDLWNPQAAKAESYTAEFTHHFVPNTQFFGDARNGTLPAVSWVIPSGQESDHPPDNSTLAQAYVASVVDAVESSPDWNTTALFVTWDDYGGFYDSVRPPVVNGSDQLGFRVPLLIVSPYVKPGTISGQFGYFESILHLMEWRFGLGCITALDCNAPVPIDAFDFSGPPRAPVLIPTNVSAATYPMTESEGTLGRTVGGFFPPANVVEFPGGPAPDVD